jgi:hypothetical protein
MSTTTTANQNAETLLRKAALIAGLGVLIMALTVPVVEFYIFPRLIDHKNPAQTTYNITNNTKLFSTAIFIHFMTVICDIVVAWALYIFFTPVHKYLSLLATLFRLVYTAFNIAALLNLIQILSLLKVSEQFTSIQSNQIHDSVLFHLHSFNLQWRFGLVFFGIYLLLLAYLAIKAPYVPNIIGVLLVLAGLGYLIDDLKYFFYPKFDTGFLWFTFFAELTFMLWLLIKGSSIHIKQMNHNHSSEMKTNAE